MTPKTPFFTKCFLALLCCSLYTILPAIAQVGINTTTPKTTLDINGGISLREGPALVLSNGANSNISLGTTPYSFYRITGPTAAFSISGIVPVIGADGQIVILQNTTSQSMTITNNSTSVAANRIYVSGDKDLLLRGIYTTVTLQYSASLSKWVLLDKMNHIETWYLTSATIAASSATTFTATIPNLSALSSASVNFVGTINTTAAASLYIQYVEAQSGQVVFRINNTATSAVNNVTFAITVNKI